MRKSQYTDDEFACFVAIADSYNHLVSLLGFSKSGTTVHHCRKRINKLNLSTNHFNKKSPTCFRCKKSKWAGEPIPLITLEDSKYCLNCASILGIKLTKKK